MYLVISAVVVFFAVVLGGTFALKFKDKLHLILGFSAGSVIGVAFFELLPEAYELGLDFYEHKTIALFIVCGFLIYTVLDRLLSHSHHDHECENQDHRGVLGAGSISLHSLVDGIIVGLSFQVSVALGVALVFAIFAHAFSDGINTVNMIIRSGGEATGARKWLALNSVSPAMGIFLSTFINIKENIFPVIISIFCGFFIYLGASDLLPESHHNHPKVWTTVSTILGIFLIFIVSQIAGH